MADNNDIKAANDTLKGIEADLKKAQDMADLFFKQAASSTGEAAKNLDKMGGIWESLSKNTSEYLKLQKELKVQEEARLKLLSEIRKLETDESKEGKDKLELKKKEFDESNRGIMKQREALANTEKQILAQKKVVAEIENSTGALGKFFESGKAKLVAYLASTERLIQAVRGFSQAARDVTDISIQSGSFLGMTGDFKNDFLTTGKAAFEYGTQLSIAETKLGLLGIKSEEVRQSFKEFSKITPFAGQAAQLDILTTATGALSKELGVSLGEATEYVTESTLKYNRTAAQSAQTLYDVKNAVMTTNQELGRTVIVGRDVTKMLFDLARESTAGAQDQDALAKTITANMVNLQAQGNTLDQATRATQTYIEAITTKAPDWARYLAGPELMKEVGKLNDDMKAQLEAAQPGIIKRINDIQASALAPFEKQQQIQKMLEGTRLGMDVMGKQVDKFIFDSNGKVKAGAALTIQGLYGITDPLLQQQFIQTRQMEHDVQAGVDAYKKANKDSTDTNAKYFLAHQDDLHDKIMGDLQKVNQQKIKDADALKKKATEDRAKALEDEIKTLAVGSDARIAAEKKLAGLTGTGLEKTAEQALKEQKGSGALANPGQAVINFLQSPTGALLTGLVGIGSLLANSLIQTGLLAKIAAVPVSSIPGLAGNTAINAVKGAGGLIKSGAGAVTSALGAEASVATVGGLATTLGAAAIAGAIGYELGQVLLKLFPSLGSKIGEKIYDWTHKSDKQVIDQAAQKQFAKSAELFNQRNNTKLSAEDFQKAVENHTLQQYMAQGVGGTPVAPVGVAGTPVANVQTAPAGLPPAPPGVSSNTGGGPSAPSGATSGNAKIIQTPRGAVAQITIPGHTVNVDLGAGHAINNKTAATYSGGQ
jgi:hypothetical protein